MLATVNGIELYYEDRGKGPVLVFVHGLGENSNSWKYQMEFFEKTFRVIAMDLRGHGKSADGEEPITMTLFADDVLALLEGLGIKKAHFVGHSMGGLINQEIAAHHGSSMQTMVLSDAAGFYPPPFGTTGLEERLRRIDTMSMDDVAQAIVDVACCPTAPAAIKAEVKEMFAANRKVPYRQATIATLKADYRPYHSQMTMPTLLLVGQYDQTTPLSYAQFLNAAIPGSKLQIIPGAAHMTKLENPTAYNRAVAEFLAPFEPEASLPLLR